MGKVSVTSWGVLPDGHASAGIEVLRVVLKAGGNSCAISALGCTVTELHIDSGDSNSVDVVLGFDDLESYATRSPFFGCIVGRHAGRLEPKITLDGVDYELAASDGGGGGIDRRTNLHGGKVGWDKRVWAVKEHASTEHEAWVTLAYTSLHMEEGFPGEVRAEVTYRLTAHGRFHLEYTATTDRTTVVSLTNHTYFNLNRDHTINIREHTLTLRCDAFAKGAESGTGVPTGELAPVAGTVHDFLHPKQLGSAIDAIAAASPLWPHGEGFVVRENEGKDANIVAAGDINGLGTVAILSCPATKLTLTVLSSEPQVQTYYSTLLEDTEGKGGTVYTKHGAICLETQRFANAVNRPTFPTHVITPEQPYRQHTVWQFEFTD